MSKVTVWDNEITIYSQNDEDFICITDIAKHRDSKRTDYIIQNWLRNRNTIELLGFWEQLNNPNFNSIEFDGFRNQSGLNSFVMTPKKWIQSTNAIGLISKSGRYGGTYAHKDIAFEFASWVSVEFKLYLIKEFQRLKDAERKQLGWDIKRNLSKINYRIHTDAIRDYANIAQLICLSNLENLNALFISDGLTQEQRVKRLNQIAIGQMRLLTEDSRVKRLGVPANSIDFQYKTSQ